MKLKAWLEITSITDVELSGLIGKSPSYIHKVKKSKLNPSLKIALRIEKITLGAVKCADLISHSDI